MPNSGKPELGGDNVSERTPACQPRNMSVTPLRVDGRTYLIGGYQGGLRGNTYTATFLLDETTRIARPVAYVGSDRCGRMSRRTRTSWPWLPARRTSSSSRGQT